MKSLAQNYRNANFTIQVKFVISTIFAISLIALMPNVSAQYKEIKRLGTSQAICKPGIETGVQLQSFFSNNTDMITKLLSDSNWGGNTQQLFNAVANGEFTETAILSGTTFEWMAMREKGEPAISPNRVWAGAQSFEAYEVNLVNTCMNYQLVVPKVCCNLSLIAATQVEDSPMLNIAVDGNSIQVCTDPGADVTFTRPDGASFGLSLDANACWSDDNLAPGNYVAEAAAECGATTRNATIASLVAATAVSVSDKPSWIPFIAAIAGTETLMRYEAAWDMEMRDSSGIIGARAGVKKAIGDTLFLVPEIGITKRNGINNGNTYPDTGVNLDLGIEKLITEHFFVGAGIGLWDVDDSDYREGSVFIRTGGAITNSTEWFLEARGVDSDNPDGHDGFSDNRVFSGGVRYLFK